MVGEKFTEKEGTDERRKRTKGKKKRDENGKGEKGPLTSLPLSSL